MVPIAHAVLPGASSSGTGGARGAGLRDPVRKWEAGAARGRGAGSCRPSRRTWSLGMPPERSAMTAQVTISPPNASTAGSIASSEPPVVGMSSTSRIRSPGAITKSAAELPARCLVGFLYLFGKDRPDAELARRLEREDDAARRWPGDHVHHRGPVGVAMPCRPRSRTTRSWRPDPGGPGISPGSARNACRS